LTGSYHNYFSYWNRKSCSSSLSAQTIYLKCENLQPFCSFKVRGACFAISKLGREKLGNGVCGASAGNFAQGLGYMARQFETSCTMLVPEYIPQTKLSRVLELGVNVEKVPFSDWWNAILTRTYDGIGDATFIHPVDENVMAGHGTIGLEIMDDLPQVDTVICPYGSGGLIAGVASAIKSTNPNVRILACEPETASPLKYSKEQGRASIFPDHKPSFVDGMGGKQVLEEMWPYVHHLVDDSVPVSLKSIADSISLLVDRSSLVVEGAGAATLAAALSDRVPDGNIVCVLSGGNIDQSKLETIFHGEVPQ